MAQDEMCHETRIGRTWTEQMGKWGAGGRGRKRGPVLWTVKLRDFKLRHHPSELGIGPNDRG